MTELLFEHVVGERYERAGVAGLLRLRIQDVLHASTGDDWQAIPLLRTTKLRRRTPR